MSKTVMLERVQPEEKSDTEQIAERLDYLAKLGGVESAPWSGSTMRAAARTMREQEQAIVKTIRLIETDVIRVRPSERDQLIELLETLHHVLLT